MEKRDSIISGALQMIMSDTEFNGILREQATMTKEVIEASPRDNYIPMLFVFYRHAFDKPIQSIGLMLAGDFPPPMGAPLSRYDIMRAVAGKYADMHIKNKKPGKKCMPIAIFLNIEAWYREMKREEMEKRRAEQGKYMSIDRDKESQEIIMTTGMTMDKRVNSAMMSIKRDKHNNIYISGTQFNEYDPLDKKREWQSDLLSAFWQGLANSIRGGLNG